MAASAAGPEAQNCAIIVKDQIYDLSEAFDTVTFAA